MTTDIGSVIERYVAGAGVPARCIAGLSPEELNSHPVPGKWSVQQVVAHLADSDLIAADRMKRIAAMDRPLLMGYDETAFAKVFAFDRMDIAAACELFRLNRVCTASLLRHLPPEAFERKGIHSERGMVTLRGLLEDYCGHLEHHVRLINDKRRAMGKAEV